MFLSGIYLVQNGAFQYVATPSNGALPLSSEIDSRFFETKGKHGHHKGKNGTEWKDNIDWAKCKAMNKTSDEFDKECGAKNDKWKGGKGVLEGRDPLTVEVRFQEMPRIILIWVDTIDSIG